MPSAPTNSVGAAPIGKKLDADTIYVGDHISIVYSDAPVTIGNTELQVPETGKINVHKGYEIEVANKKTYDVAKELTALYIDKEKIYKQITVVVNVLGRSVSVGGEVKAPGQFGHDGNITVMRAINKAGGFTEYANRKKVTVTRLDGNQLIIDCKKAVNNPKLDIALYPGDVVYVSRRGLSDVLSQ
ncbi:MAG TPA: SLBB domain-containing protein [Candidatus Limnocylindria bacterium]|nr:SLBB domain-containing protein [Candidatus Limnocylindria bacterium]